MPRLDVDENRFDSGALLRLHRFGGEKLVSELVRLFTDQSLVRLAAAQASMAAHDAAGVRSALHALKSSAAQLGATRVQQLCQTGESGAAAGDLSGVPALLEDLEAELARSRQWLAAATPVAP